jgi:hypothetical protein
MPTLDGSPLDAAPQRKDPPQYRGVGAGAGDDSAVFCFTHGGYLVLAGTVFGVGGNGLGLAGALPVVGK